VLDLLRYAAVPGGATTTAIEELGDPDDPRDALVLAAYSPYHHLEPADYPPILVVAAEHDVRTPPWHSRKFVARLQSVTYSSAPAMLRIWKAMGHGTGATATTERTAEWLGFIMEHLGVEPRKPGSDASSDGPTRP
jgi:prolyl oligopeptidase